MVKIYAVYFLLKTQNGTENNYFLDSKPNKTEPEVPPVEHIPQWQKLQLLRCG